MAWYDIFYKFFSYRFSKVISEERLKELAKIFATKIDNYSPKVIYTNLLYCSIESVISEISIEYAERFYRNPEETFENPEIPIPSTLTTIEKHDLNKFINDQMIIINHQVETTIHSHQNINFYESTKQLSNVFNVNIIKPILIPIVIDHIIYYLSPQKYAYLYVFHKLNNIICDDIPYNSYFSLHIKYMEEFKERYPNGCKYELLL